MSKTKSNGNGNAEVPRKVGTRRSVGLATKGIHTSTQFAAFQSALIGDIMNGAVTPTVANAASKSCANLLEVVKMEYKYGVRKQGELGSAVLMLASKVIA